MIFTSCVGCNEPIVYPYESGDDFSGAFDRQPCESCGAINYIQRLSLGGVTLSEAEAIERGITKKAMSARDPRPPRERRRRFAVRTIRDGLVRINGHDYAPKALDGQGRVPYDGRLDGQRFAFGLYYVGETLQPYVSLWGTERAYRSKEPGTDWPGPHCVNGYFAWDCWDRTAAP